MDDYDVENTEWVVVHMTAKASEDAKYSTSVDLDELVLVDAAGNDDNKLQTYSSHVTNALKAGKFTPTIKDSYVSRGKTASGWAAFKVDSDDPAAAQPLKIRFARPKVEIMGGGKDVAPLTIEKPLA